MATLAVAIAVPSTTAAQESAPSGVVVSPGELVRVRTAQWEYTGTLARVVNDTAVVLFNGDSVRVPRSLVLRTEVQRGTRRSTPRVLLGTVAGAGVGALVGGGAGMLIECGSTCGDDGDLEGIAGMVLGAGTGIVLGAIVGGVWGAKKRYPRWIQAALP